MSTALAIWLPGSLPGETALVAPCDDVGLAHVSSSAVKVVMGRSCFAPFQLGKELASISKRMVRFASSCTRRWLWARTSEAGDDDRRRAVQMVAVGLHGVADRRLATRSGNLRTAIVRLLASASRPT